MCYVTAMARTRTKPKATKRKTTKKAAKPRRSVAKKGRKASSKRSAPKTESLTSVVSSKAIDLLRSWAPSRYSHR